MVLTNKQEKGLQIAIKRFNDKELYTCISGYAGTGKSTLVKYIVAALDLNPEDDVAYIAYTGKAAEVLRHKGCSNATTAHKLLYKSKPLPNGKFKYVPRKALDKDYKLIVVDEISMLPIELWNLLLKHRVYIIACGDPFQLPPINQDSDNHILDKPHIFLDEIMRQAAESEIIRLSMDIRNNKPIDYFKGNEVQVLRKEEVSLGMYQWADQIIVGTNSMRLGVNNLVRESYNRGPVPEKGDKLICLRNCWDTIDSEGESALVNGTIGYINNYELRKVSYPIWGVGTIPVLELDFITTTNEHFKMIWADYKAILNGEKTLTPKQEYSIFISESSPPAPIEFNYGYGITCHRAQGSEWNKVLVIEEKFPFNKEEHARWLYTACTRSSEKLLLVR